MGSSPEPAVPAYSRLRMHRKRPQVLGVDLNRPEIAAWGGPGVGSHRRTSWVMMRRYGRGRETSVASSFSNMRSIRMALGFIGADQPRCRAIVPICSRMDIEFIFLGSDPLIRNVVDDLLHAVLELL